MTENFKAVRILALVVVGSVGLLAVIGGVDLLFLFGSMDWLATFAVLSIVLVSVLAWRFFDMDYFSPRRGYDSLLYRGPGSRKRRRIG